MKFYAKAFDLVQKNWIVAIPLLIACLIPQFLLIGAIFNIFSVLGNIGGMLSSINSGADALSVMTSLVAAISLLLAPLMAASMLQTVLTIIASPITYGMANSVIQGEKIGFESFVPMLTKFIVPFIIYWLACIVLGVLVSIGLTIVSLILGFVFGLMGIIGAILLVLFVIAIAIISVIVMLKLSFWFVIMVNEGVSVIDAMKKSFETTKGVTLTIFGIFLLNALLFGVASLILGYIPVIGVLIGGLLSGAASVLFIVFLFVTYFNKTGKVAAE